MTPGALAGVRVLDLTRYIPGPYCTLLLGDLGADVVKVEQPPIGDPVRLLPPAVADDSALHAALNRNKRSIAVDLRQAAGAGVVRRLARAADVVVESFRPGVLARHGLGYDDLCGENPRLVYCSVSGFGQDGPLAGLAAHDVNYCALGGLLAASRDADGRPILPGTQLADMTGGLLASIGVLAALQARERTGCGQLVDVSLLEGVLALMTVPLSRQLAGGPERGELAGTHACYNVYRCRDGRYLAVGALEPKFWEALCRTLGRPELIGRQWDDGAGRLELIDEVAGLLATRDRDEWLRELAGRDACVTPVLDAAEAYAQPQAARAAVRQPAGASLLRTLANPVRLSCTPATSRRPAPRLGEHAGEVLGEAGYAEAEIAALRSQGVVA